MPRKPNTARNDRIKELYGKGLSMVEIARRFNITKQRVFQIITGRK